jgi:hypothetical protein
MLVVAQLLDENLSMRLKAMFGFRNIATHEYQRENSTKLQWATVLYPRASYSFIAGVFP